jgi:hypothetical protein
MATLHLRDRAADELLEDRPVEIGQAPEVQAGLAHAVPAEAGPQGLLLPCALAREAMYSSTVAFVGRVLVSAMEELLDRSP